MFICMDYYDGETLQDKLRSGALSIDESIEIAMQIAQGLERAHKKRIAHRDIKPANIMITRDNDIRILDFGIAKLAGQTKLTRTGTTVGTVSYMSPEQARGEAVDHQTDIWSLGVMFYEMVTGEQPFKGEYEQAVIYSILNEKQDPVRKLKADLPQGLETVIAKALVKEKEERYQEAQEVIKDLARFKEGAKISGRSWISKTQFKHAVKRFWIPVAAVIILALALIFFRSLFFGEALRYSKMFIAVLPFENETGDPRYDHLCKAIQRLLITKLGASKYLDSWSPSLLKDQMKMMRETESQPLTRESWMELLRYQNIKKVMLGTIDIIGSTFIMTAEVLDIESKEILAIANEEGEGENSIILEQIDKLMKDILKDLNLSQKVQRDAMSRPIAEVTTRSMKAWNYYQKGIEEYEKSCFKKYFVR